jgi:hypothetical protein
VILIERQCAAPYQSTAAPGGRVAALQSIAANDRQNGRQSVMNCFLMNADWFCVLFFLFRSSLSSASEREKDAPF